MTAALIITTALPLVACSQEPANSETVEDFASCVGAPASVAEGAAPGPVETASVMAAPPANANVFQLAKLGNIGGIDQVRSGTPFAGEYFSARITRIGTEQASLTIADAAGTQKAFAGNWVCS